MNKCFFATDQGLIIKVLTTPEKARREIAGIAMFSEYVTVPQLELLDTKTISISILDSTKSTLIPNTELTNLVYELLCTIAKNPVPAGAAFSDNSLHKKIAELKVYFQYKPGVVERLDVIEKQVNGTKLYPVHADLQKQNIFIGEDGLQLIDFEHFIIAPLELELVNSLFFNDANCLDVDTLIPRLLQGNSISASLLPFMLEFYAINQIAEGRKVSNVNKRLLRAGMRIKKLTKQPLKMLPIDCKSKKQDILALCYN